MLRLISALPDQSPSFVFGFEAGVLWILRKTRPKRTSKQPPTENRRVIGRLAHECGRRAELAATEIAGWDHTWFEKDKPGVDVASIPALKVVC